MNADKLIRSHWELIAFVVLTLTSQGAMADRYGTVVLGGDPLIISSNETANVIFVGGASSAGVIYQRTGGSSTTITLQSSTSSGGGGSVSSVSPLPLVGPATITIASGAGTVLGIRIVNTDLTSSGTSSIPSTAVVIPQDATGPVQIILESSRDLINWNAATPGTYGSNATNRFFRVRAIAN
jgi:hypothetical protein